MLGCRADHPLNAARTISRMSRNAALSTVLHLAIQRRPKDAVAYCDSGLASTGDAWLLSLRSFAAFFAQDFADATESAARAVATADDDESIVFSRVATAWASAGSPSPYDGDAHADALAALPLLDGVDRDRRAFIEYLLAEAGLGCARLDFAARVMDQSAPVPEDFLAEGGAPHPYLAMMTVMRARLVGFQGRVTEALEIVAGIDPAPGTPEELLVTATACLLHGNNARKQSVREIADRLERELGEPSDYISAGCYILVSFGLIATTDIARAASFVLKAGHTAGLDGLSIIDRALGLEMLVAAAVAEGDLGAAQAWRLRAAPLLESTIAQPTIERINSRVSLLEGDAAEAARWAGLAVEHAKLDGRAIEAAEGEIVLSRARIALSERGAASIGLEAMAAAAASSGHLSAQKSAARELRAIGRRLRPLAGSGWAGLSARERDVALLVAEGFGNQAIAAELHLSEHTVQAHVSRVLAAFGAASRLTVAAQLTSLLPRDPDAPPPPALTPRQQMVAERIATGRSNEAIAAELGVSVKTVEKHVSEILRRWQVASRIGIARLALSTAA